MSVGILGVDPGFASFGWSDCALEGRSPHAGEALTPIKVGLIETKKSPKKMGLLQSSDNLRRLRELHEKISEVVDDMAQRYDRIILAVESQSWPRNSMSSAKIGMAWGVLASVTHAYAMEQISPQAIKKILTGQRSASKEAVLAAVRDIWPRVDDLLSSIPSSKREHPVDALAASIAVVQSSEMVRYLR